MTVWQWGILVVGVVAVIGMVWFARRGNAADPWVEGGTASSAPSLDDDGIDLVPADARRGPVMDDLADVAPPAAEEAEPHPVLIYVVSRDRKPIAGPRLHQALAEAKLHHGMQDFYHRTTEINGSVEPVFSVANMLKPGTLDPMHAAELQTPGIVFFMNVPNPMGGLRAVREMLDAAQTVAALLGCELLDGSRAALTDDRIQALLQDIARRDPAGGRVRRA